MGWDFAGSDWDSPGTLNQSQSVPAKSQPVPEESQPIPEKPAVSRCSEALLLRHVLERLLQQLPEGCHGLYECALGGGVRTLHRGTEGDNVEMRILA